MGWERFIDLTAEAPGGSRRIARPAVGPTVAPPRGGAAVRGVRLIVLTDNLGGAGGLVDQLRTARPDIAMEIVRASTVAGALVALDSGAGDLALIDLAALGRSELGAEEAIRSLSASAPVVALTGEANDADALDLMRAGASDVVSPDAVTVVEAARIVGLAADHRGRSFERKTDLVGQWLLLDLSRTGHADVGLPELLGMAARVLAEALSVPRAAVVELVGDTAVLRGSAGLPEEQVGSVVASTQDGTWVATAAASECGDPVTVGEPGDGSTWLVQPIHVGPRRWGLIGAVLPANRDPTERELAYLGQLTASLAGFIATSGSDAQLAERVRALTALRRIADASEADLPKERLVSEAADALVVGVRYPDAAVAEVELDGRRASRWGGERAVPVRWRTSVDVVVQDEVRGRVELAYLRPVLRPDEPDALLQPVARILSSWLRRTDTDERLRASDARNRLQAAALATAPSAVFITDSSGTIEWVNHAFTEVSGYPAERAVGATPSLLWSGEHDAEVFEELWNTITDGHVWRGQLVNRHADGHLYVVSQTITPVRGEHGRSTHFVAIQEEITERVETQRELEAGRQRLQALFDTALDAIALFDAEGRYLDVNPAMARLTDYPRNALLAMRWQDLAAADRGAEGPGAEGPGAEGPGAEGPGAEGPGGEAAGHADRPPSGISEAGIFTLRRRDGAIVEAEYRAVADIQPGVHLSVLRDVTAHRAMVRELADREARIRRLAENVSDIVAQLTRDATSGWTVDYVNRAATELLGHPLQELEADPRLLSQLLDDPQAPGDPLAPLFKGEKHTEMITAQVPRADGQRLWFEVNVSVGDPSCAPVTVQLIARDITAHRQTQEALEEALRDQQEAGEHLRSLSAMKDTFLQSVSHELRTPLTAIHGFASLLTERAGELSSDRAVYFNERILTNANRLHRLLDDLLDVDRVARGSVQLARTATDLAALVRRTIDEAELGAHPIDLHLETVTLRVDPAWVERIVDNLIGNVLRHTPATTRIGVRLEPSDNGAKLIVDDDGPGIPPEERHRVLEPFQQGGSSASDASPGTGMGLALVDSFARMHGGEVTIGESPWGGTRVSVTLGNS